MVVAEIFAVVVIVAILDDSNLCLCVVVSLCNLCIYFFGKAFMKSGNFAAAEA